MNRKTNSFRSQNTYGYLFLSVYVSVRSGSV